ncbi:MAG: hypothetical protein L0H73_10345 [Nitrococcus sp.]|nr:hypothetical protein [Nitrococcus sp.]
MSSSGRKEVDTGACANAPPRADSEGITRFSSRRRPLDAAYFNDTLAGARSYDRIAGYFSSSILEIAGEAIDKVTGRVRVVCNSSLHPQDVATAKAAKQAQHHEWNASGAIARAEQGPERFRRLFELLRTAPAAARASYWPTKWDWAKPCNWVWPHN